MFNNLAKLKKIQKNITCNRFCFISVGAHPLLRFLVSIKNFGSVKKITHMCPTPQNFFLAFIDDLDKQVIIKKTPEVGK